jgi:GMP reductase
LDGFFSHSFFNKYSSDLDSAEFISYDSIVINPTPLFDFDDLLIQPEIASTITSRKQVNPYDSMNFLPLFTAPMDTVINRENQDVFYSKGIHTILPRQAEIDEVSYVPGKWLSYNIHQFEQHFLLDKVFDKHAPILALLDIANGHMERLTELVHISKILYPNLIVMFGNVAHPKTFLRLAESGADFIRVGIGNGGGCLTTQQTGIGYPMGSLIDECRKIKAENHLTTKIVADGGMKKYSDIIKALALGADYVMLGNILNKALESCSPNVVDIGNSYYKPYEEYYSQTASFFDAKNGEISEAMKPFLMRIPKTAEQLMNDGCLYKKFRGMSTKSVQEDMGNTIIKTSEGVVRYQKVEYTLDTWIKNFTDYLRSAMSYTNSATLKDFRESTLNVITVNAQARFNK